MFDLDRTIVGGALLLVAICLCAFGYALVDALLGLIAPVRRKWALAIVLLVVFVAMAWGIGQVLPEAAQ